MTTVDGICSDIRNLDGAVGAFVWHRSRCVASSLPKNYDSIRLGQAGSGLWRTMLLARTAGYSGSPSAFHWQRTSLYGWAVGEEGLLGIITTPKVSRSVLEVGATSCAEALERILAAGANPDTPLKASPVPGIPTRLAHLQRMLDSELGTTGRLLLDRSVRRAWQPGVPESIWLPRLRAIVLAEIEDVPTRERLGASPWWD